MYNVFWSFTRIELFVRACTPNRFASRLDRDLWFSTIKCVCCVFLGSNLSVVSALSILRARTANQRAHDSCEKLAGRRRWCGQPVCVCGIQWEREIEFRAVKTESCCAASLSCIHNFRCFRRSRITEMWARDQQFWVFCEMSERSEPRGLVIRVHTAICICNELLTSPNRFGHTYFRQ